MMPNDITTTSTIMRPPSPLQVILLCSIVTYSSALSFANRAKSRGHPQGVGGEDNSENVGRRQFLSAGSLLLSLSLPTSSSWAMTIDKKTGIALPDPGEIENAIPSDWNTVDNPLEGDMKTMFGRLDSKPDEIFYQDPRFVEHVDEKAVSNMASYITEVATKDGDSVLDLCSSWTSHINLSKASKLKQFSGLGMNEQELRANKPLTDFVVQDLNANPTLPYRDATYDTILCQLSIDYLTKPTEVMKEVSRVLKPGGKVHIIFSNRLFISKAVGIWTGADDIDHAFLVGAYLQFSGGEFTNIKAIDLSSRQGRDRRIIGDPLYVVTATRKE